MKSQAVAAGRTCGSLVDIVGQKILKEDEGVHYQWADQGVQYQWANRADSTADGAVTAARCGLAGMIGKGLVCHNIFCDVVLALIPGGDEAVSVATNEPNTNRVFVSTSHKLDLTHMLMATHTRS
eukprot:SAG11_NODE_2345_length_3487_cov_1.677981_5_plen_125_part_00